MRLKTWFQAWGGCYTRPGVAWYSAVPEPARYHPGPFQRHCARSFAMPLLPIVLYPDPVLRQKALPVEEFDAGLQTLVTNMVESMHAAPGIGLAAPQVGISRRLAVVDLSVGERPEELIVLVNPTVIEEAGTDDDTEGCLSIPDFTDSVRRSFSIAVTAQDADGNAFTLEAEGLLARAICHEIDHLDGILFTDRLRGLRKERARRFLRRLARDAEDASS